MLIDLIAGARPNFIKMAPIIEAIKKQIDLGENIKFRLIHTGQHYDDDMSAQFFKALEIPNPDINLGAGGGTQSEQTSTIMVGYERLLAKSKSDLCLVVGDVNSTMACSIVAKKNNIKVAHVEAGIRSGDDSMPEEINRKVTDSISDFFFTTSLSATENLIKQGVNVDCIYFVGNVMIDTLYKFKSRFKKPEIWGEINLKKDNYILCTLHRPSNVDDRQKLLSIINEICENVNNLPILFPVHPRTQLVLKKIKINHPNLFFTKPMGYLEFNYLTKNAKGVITDSGGITEETTVMGVPCITVRNNTERPETVSIGTNELIGDNPEAIKPALNKLFKGQWKKGGIPEKWDGKSAERIVSNLIKILK
tara:strand:+ start:57375 stop:58466 length:1092 start_codon:yes stop_codon:yes gene_type:complete